MTTIKKNRESIKNHDLEGKNQELKLPTKNDCRRSWIGKGKGDQVKPRQRRNG
jgi:hypothetical protein